MEHLGLTSGRRPAPIAVGYGGGAGHRDLAPALRRLAEDWNGPVLHLWPADLDAPTGGDVILIDPADPAGAVASLRAAAPEVAVLFAGPGWSVLDLAYLCAAAGVSRRIGFEEEFAGAVLTDRVAPPESARAADRAHALAEAAACLLPGRTAAGSDVADV